MAVFLAKQTEGRLTNDLRHTEFGTFGTFHQTEEYNGEKRTKFFDFKLSKNCKIPTDLKKGCLVLFGGMVDSYDDKNGHQKLALLVYSLEVIFPPFEEKPIAQGDHTKPVATGKLEYRDVRPTGGLGF